MSPMSLVEMYAVVATGRCPICEWPLARSAKEGCVLGDCCYRPDRPAEQAALAANRATFARLKPLLHLADRNPVVHGHLAALRHRDHPDLTSALLGIVLTLAEINERAADYHLVRLLAEPTTPADAAKLRADLKQNLARLRRGSTVTLPADQVLVTDRGAVYHRGSDAADTPAVVEAPPDAAPEA